MNPHRTVRRRHLVRTLVRATAGYALCLGLNAGGVAGEPVPEPRPPVEVRRVNEAAPAVVALETVPSSTYSIGDPSDDEQGLLELLNRARADAGAEAVRLMSTTDPSVTDAYRAYLVNLSTMTNQFADLPPALPPLSMNASLLAAARCHSWDMLANQFQGHYSSSNAPWPNVYGDNPGQRITKQGYTWQTYGENVFAYAKSVFFAHAGFEVDWAATNDLTAIGGMQSPPGHRYNVHGSNYYEIGIGIVKGVNGIFGPLSVTEDFATYWPTAVPFITGVAYYDLDGNGFYDPGEGLGGITATVAGLTTGAVTAVSGGYSIPVPSNGIYSVTFSGPYFQATTSTVSVTNFHNVKLDFRPAYAPPSLSGPGIAFTGGTNIYSIGGLGGATQHEVRVLRLATNNWSEGAETGTNHVNLATSPGYSPITSSVRYQGSFSFHLAHPAFEAQTLTLARLLYVQNSNATIQFQSRLGTATSSQVAKVQLSCNEGASWTNLYTQAGTGQPGETTFSARSIPLIAHTGSLVRLRFVYDVSTSAYTDTITGVGWYIDNISAPGSREVLSTTNLSVAAGACLAWIPPASGDYLLQVRGTYDRRVFPYSRLQLIPASNLRFEINSLSQLATNRYQVHVHVTSGSAGSLGLDAADTLTNEFNPVTITSSNPAAGQYYLLHTFTNASARRFYRVRGN